MPNQIMAIPIIDFTKCGLLVEHEDQIDKCDLSKVGKELYEAFSTSGFAYLKGAGISKENFKKTTDAGSRFFALPLAEKNKFDIPDSPTFGYDRSGKLHANRERPSDQQEGFRVTAVNSDTEWPDIPQFKETVEEFQERCKRLTLRILRALGVGMKLKDPHYLYNCHAHMNQAESLAAMKFHHYAPITEDDPLLENQLRLGEHTDFGSLTLLFQDEIEGLQIQGPDGDFIDATPIPDTVALNIGDSLQFWSGGRLKSTVHRVVPPVDPQKRNKIRISIGYFVGADQNVVLKKLEFEGDDVMEERAVDGAPDMTYKEYVAKRLTYFYPEVSE